VRIFNLKKGESVGYGRRFVAKRDMTCALIPAGNADGYLLKPVTSHYTLKTALKDVAGTLLKWTGRRPDVVEVNGQKCPILDASPVQQTVIDVTGKTVSLGDSVRLGIRRPIAGAMIPRNYVYLGQTYAGEEALLSALNFEK